MANHRVEVVRQHIGASRQGGRRVGNERQCQTPTETMKDLESLPRTGVDGFIDLISHVRSHNGSSLELHGLHRSDSCDAPFAPNFHHVHFEFLGID